MSPSTNASRSTEQSSGGGGGGSTSSSTGESAKSAFRMGLMLRAARRPGQAAEKYASALDDFRRCGNKQGEFDTLVELAIARREDGGMAAARAAIDAAKMCADGDLFRMGTAYLTHANLELAAGDYATAHALASDCLRFVQLPAAPAEAAALLPFGFAALGCALWHLRRLQEAIAALNVAVSQALVRMPPGPPREALVRRCRGLIASAASAVSAAVPAIVPPRK